MRMDSDEKIRMMQLADPTLLTTQQLLREINSLKELVMTRINSIDQAVVISHADLVRVPTEVQKAVGTLKDLHEERFHSVNNAAEDLTSLVNEKFSSVEKQFKERDIRVEQTAKDTKVAVDAALQAAEKAVGKQNESFALSIAKSEAATMKQIDQIVALMNSNNSALDSKIVDVKDRIGAIEGRGSGRNSLWIIIIGGIAALASIVSIVSAIIIFMKK